MDAIRKHNGLDSDVIRVGQRPEVAATAAPPAIRMVKGQSVGSPQRGKLAQGARLQQSKRYYRRRLPRTYAAAHVVDQVAAAIGAVSDAHPKAKRLAIGDLSDQDGGSLSGHNSHQSGRDVDLGLYFKKQPAGYPREFVAAAKGQTSMRTRGRANSSTTADVEAPGPGRVSLLASAGAFLQPKPRLGVHAKASVPHYTFARDGQFLFGRHHYTFHLVPEEKHHH